MTIEVPACPCTVAARRLPAVLPVPARYRTEGGGAGNGSGPCFGFAVVSCGYCGSVLATAEGIDVSEPLGVREADA